MAGGLIIGFLPFGGHVDPVLTRWAAKRLPLRGKW